MIRSASGRNTSSRASFVRWGSSFIPDLNRVGLDRFVQDGSVLSDGRFLEIWMGREGGASLLRRPPRRERRAPCLLNQVSLGSDGREHVVLRDCLQLLSGELLQRGSLLQQCDGRTTEISGGDRQISIRLAFLDEDPGQIVRIVTTDDLVFGPSREHAESIVPVVDM